jgi:hypothetical protein
MSAETKPLFRPEAVRPKVKRYMLPQRAEDAMPKLRQWADKFENHKLDKMKETELLPLFLSDIFGEVLGYTTPLATGDTYTIKREATIEVDSNRPDAVLGTFGLNLDVPTIVVEGKGPLDPLDKPYKSRSESAVRQALSYARNLKLDWYIVTNMRETRLYSKQTDERTLPYQHDGIR